MTKKHYLTKKRRVSNLKKHEKEILFDYFQAVSKKKGFSRKVLSMLSPPSSPSPDASPKNSRKSSPARKSDKEEEPPTKDSIKEINAKVESLRMSEKKISRTSSMNNMLKFRTKSFPVKGSPYVSLNCFLNLTFC